MPGTRLTRQDRSAIAKGLAAGLDYAEIARRIARPTSTVSREVLRNGGPIEYGAGAAQQATRRRARRRRTAAAVPHRRRTGTAELRRFEQQFVTALVDVGMTRMPARVLAALYTTDDGHFTAATLAEHLAVSSASISKAVRYLEGQAMIRRELVPMRRAERYVVVPDTWFRALVASANRNRRLAEIAGRGATVVAAGTPAAARLAAMSRFHQLLTDEIVSQATQWRHLLTDA